jgi:hypothetical protein
MLSQVKTKVKREAGANHHQAGGAETPEAPSGVLS